MVTRQPGLNPRANEYSPPTTNSMYSSANTAVLLQTARARVYHPDKPQPSVEVRVILDSGSQCSYVTHNIRDALSFGAEREEEHECDVVIVGMKTADGEVLELLLFTVPLICEQMTNQPIAFCKGEYEHLAHLELAEFCVKGEDMAIDILIGSDHYWKLATGQVVQGERGPTAIHTKLGWVLSGPTDAPGQQVLAFNVVTNHTLRIDAQPQSGEELDATLRRFWELESLGIKNGDAIVFKDGRYRVSLPWKESHPALPDNYHLCKKWLRGLLHHLRQHPPVQQQLSKGIVEQVIESECPATGETHYIPHHVVIRQDKQTTKLCVVYNASAKADGPSLNDCLYTGPKFGQNIMDIILRFRVHSVALVADIEKAFLMVSVSKKDRDVLIFLWVDNIAKDEPEIVTLRFARVMFGVSSSPFLLNATLSHHLRRYSALLLETVQKIFRSLYVDDIAYRVCTEDLAYKLYADSKSMLKEGGFNLRKFVTNSDALQKIIEENERSLQSSPVQPGGNSTEDESYTKSTLGITQQVSTGEVKVLGVRWNPSSDCLEFNFGDVASHAVNLEPTKRHIVRVTSRFYDPVGFILPITICFKVLFQYLCGEKLGWDDRLPAELLRKWRDLVSSLQQAQPISIPWYYFKASHRQVLHTACKVSATLPRPHTLR